MATADTKTPAPAATNLEWVRQGFKTFNKVMLFNWRLGLGRWMSFAPHTLGRYMVILHTGRKSGLQRRTPVNYAEIDGEIYCTAGFGSISDWYRNIRANPEVELWLPNGRWKAIAEEITGQPGELAILREVLLNSGFAARAAGINPRTLDDATLAARAADYRLMHLRRVDPVTGPGGPGDLVWVWQVVGTVLPPLITLVVRRRRRKAH